MCVRERERERGRGRERAPTLIQNTHTHTLVCRREIWTDRQTDSERTSGLPRDTQFQRPYKTFISTIFYEVVKHHSTKKCFSTAFVALPILMILN